MVSLEAIMLLCTIDAKEDRYVALTEILEAFLHTDMKDTTQIL